MNWFAYPGPRDYVPADVPRTLERLAHCDATTWQRAATAVRFAVGNDHRGTLYPAAVEMARLVVSTIDLSPGPPRKAGLDVLLDWCSFDAEPGYERFVEPNSGRRVELMTELGEILREALPILRRLAAECDRETARDCAELVDSIERGR